MVRQDEFSALELRFENESVNIKDLYEVREQLKECVRMEQIEDLQNDVDTFKKKIRIFVETEEMNKRHQAIIKQTQEWLDQKLSLSAFKTEKDGLLDKIAGLEKVQNDRYAELKARLKDHDVQIGHNS